MAAARHHRPRRPADLRGIVLLVGFFSFLLLLTWERLAIKETSGRIERLERHLQSLETDEAILRTRLKQECRFTEVQQVAQEKWGMAVAASGQRILLPSTPRTRGEEATRRVSFVQAASIRLTRMLRGGVAQAETMAGEGGNGTLER